MKDTIFLVVSGQGVKRMTKNMPWTDRGEVPVKLTVTVEDTALREPVISQEITINDWQAGIDIVDVEFKESVITPQEADLIRQRRLERMKEVLENQGYKVEVPETEE